MDKRGELTTDTEWIARLESRVRRLEQIIEESRVMLEPAAESVNPSLLRIRGALSVLRNAPS